MEAKVCSKCKTEKLIDDYSLHHPAKNSDRRRPDCKKCVRERTRKFIANDLDAQKRRMRLVFAKSSAIAKAYVQEYLLTHYCVDCNQSDPDVLDFDHVRGIKIKDVSRMIHSGYRIWRIKREIEKCEVRCANCHRKITKLRLLEKQKI
jgi:hypothetical protein